VVVVELVYFPSLKAGHLASFSVLAMFSLSRDVLDSIPRFSLVIFCCERKAVAELKNFSSSSDLLSVVTFDPLLISSCVAVLLILSYLLLSSSDIFDLLKLLLLVTAEVVILDNFTSLSRCPRSGDGVFPLDDLLLDVLDFLVLSLWS